MYMTEYDRESMLVFFFVVVVVFIKPTTPFHTEVGWVKKVIWGFLVISRVD